MINAKASEMILQRLRDCAREMARSEVRNATIDRLVDACNAIESTQAATLVKKLYGKNNDLSINPKINPSNVEKYVKARGKTDRAWTGPTRVTIAKDPDLLAYVEAREDERIKPNLPRRPSSKRRQIEDAISKLPSTELRMDLRHELENGRQAKRTLDILTQGLRKIPGIDVDKLLSSSDAQKIGTKQEIDPGPSNEKPAALTLEERNTLRRLLDRLTDRNEMSRSGLELENNRLRVVANKRSIVKPDEMAVLERLTGESSVT
jgi:hypothetical protein